MNNLVFGNDQVIADWASQKLDCRFIDVLAAIGVIDKEGLLVGAVVLHHWTTNDVELSIVGKATKALILAAAWVAFSNAGRITVRVPRKRKSIMQAAVKFGFSLEGTIRRLYGPFKRDDGIVFGMLKSEAGRFLKGMENVTAKSA